MDPKRPPNYDRHPHVDVPGHTCHCGWDAIAAEILAATAGMESPLIAIECYPGTHERGILAELAARLRPATAVFAGDALRPAEEIDTLVEPFLGGDDPVFGFISPLRLEQFFDGAALGKIRQSLDATNGMRLVAGVGATLVVPRPDVLVYADLARWEAQLRFRRNETANLGADNRGERASLQYKRGFFVDWRVADEHKKPLLGTCGFFLDTHTPEQPKLASGLAVRAGLDIAARRPFRVVPFFDPAPWGGTWMEEVCGLEPASSNYGWCFDGVPEENSLYLGFGAVKDFEIPSLDLVFHSPVELLGDPVHARFGTEFPIRFDFLDTMGGGNLSLQVHPLTEYIQRHFGMHYTQDESYYMLDAGPDAHVYLGFRTGVDSEAFLRDLETAQADPARPFPAETYVNRWPARKHDHFLIPAGTIHCSGSGSMVLEISATPYIFTFKLWDWSRPGLDGKPRPIHLGRGMEVLQFDRDTEWTRRELINRVVPVGSGDGWTEERTGLHAREFIETRRHWFTGSVPHHTGGGVNMLNLVEGDEAVVESPHGAFEPFVVHYAETFIVPASVGPYTIRPHGPSIGNKCATMKAFVRHKP